MFSELNLVQGSTASRYLSPSLPFCLRFKRRLQLMMPIRRLQNSILGVWLTLTQTGFTPACFKPFPVRTFTRWLSAVLGFIWRIARIVAICDPNVNQG